MQDDVDKARANAMATAERAQRTFDHIDENVMRIKADLFSKIQDTKSGVFGRRERDELHRQLNSLDAVVNVLKREIAGGKKALHLIEQDRKKRVAR